MAKRESRELGSIFERGEVIFHQGEAAHCMYVVQKGRVELVVTKAVGGEKQLAVFGENDMFGEIALFANKARFATARALEKCRVLTLDEKAFISRLHQDPSTAFRLLRQMAQRIYELEHEVVRAQYGFGMADEETGLPNFLDMGRFLEDEVHRAERLQQRLAFVIIDLDNFQEVKREHGEEAASEAIRQLGFSLRSSLRRADIVGRFGGDRFGIILLEAEETATLRVVENLRKGFAALIHPLPDGRVFSMTFSAGAATFPRFDSAGSLRRAARHALNQAKAAGRNQVTLAQELPQAEEKERQAARREEKK